MAEKRRRGDRHRKRGKKARDAQAKTTTAASSRAPAAVAPAASAPPVASAPLMADAWKWALASLAILVIAAYLPAMLWGGYVWDDEIFYEAEPVRALSGIWRIWLEPSSIDQEAHYWPLVYSSFWLEHKLWGFDPTGYHVTNVVLHLANTLLLWHLLRQILTPPVPAFAAASAAAGLQALRGPAHEFAAWLGAALFAVHPVHVESVAWVLERKDVLSGLFYIAAVLAWLRFMEAPKPGRYLLALVLFVAGLLSKSVVVTLPAALVLLHWWKGRAALKDLLPLLPFFLIGLVIVAADSAYYRSREIVSFDYSMVERLLIAARAAWFYFGKLVLPINQAVIYPLWEIDAADWLGWLYVVAAVGLALAAWFLRHRTGRGLLAGILYFAITLSPTLGFIDYGYMKYSLVADRFQYLACAGVLAVAAWAAVRGLVVALDAGLSRDAGLPRGASYAAVAGIAVVLVVLSGLTWRHASIYEGRLPFFEHILKHNPNAKSAYVGLGAALYGEERYEEALAAGERAIEQDPQDTKALHGIGLTLQRLNRPGEAEQAFLRTLEVDPKYADALSGLASLRFEQQRYEEALEYLLRQVRLEPKDANVYSNLGITLHYLGRSAEALEYLDRALVLNPEYATARMNREQIVRAMQEAQRSQQQP